MRVSEPDRTAVSGSHQRVKIEEVEEERAQHTVCRRTRVELTRALVSAPVRRTAGGQAPNIASSGSHLKYESATKGRQFDHVSVRSGSGIEKVSAGRRTSAVESSCNCGKVARRGSRASLRKASRRRSRTGGRRARFRETGRGRRWTRKCCWERGFGGYYGQADKKTR
ncbi:hypothetical protein BV25DRAFT_34345 [Artomyces pyxidatus]|uniref:Uncharacterized protein n=1 Tax=Artomyces pyxidatus TaxID=48021 RepID=A0ACB8TK36_9AGAM|nr:hypothetical protein BV25DRAFT_34345 [Artomyces pyxidatus]